MFFLSCLLTASGPAVAGSKQKTKTKAQASACCYKVQGTKGAGLRIRSGPGTEHSQVGSLAEGATVDIACQVRSGSNVGGSTIWDQISGRGWVSDYYVTTPRFNDFSPGIDRCGAAQPPPQQPTPATPPEPAPAPPSEPSKPSPSEPSPAPSNDTPAPEPTPSPPSSPPPPSREQRAVSWARSQIGAAKQPNGSPWLNWCDRFVANAYGRSTSGYHDANAHWSNLAKRGLVYAGNRSAPFGALVFWTGRYGHVAVSLGNGRAITTPLTTDRAKKVREMAVSEVKGYRGWSWANPEWPGR
ncbi:MAG TPA: SH3 domain-containing protein [Candidatus Dormibacteraeota bacterium]|nr:SH3 domain-containing protein [Candidatus Dormibacteraeota bacterium]